MASPSTHNLGQRTLRPYLMCLICIMVATFSSDATASLTTSQKTRLLLYEVLGVPLGMMAGTLAGAATGYFIGAAFFEQSHSRQTGIEDRDEFADEGGCCFISFTPGQMGAIIGGGLGFGLGGFLGQTTGIYLGAKNQGLRAPYGSSLLATAVSDAIGLATTGLLLVPYGMNPQQEWIIPTAMLAGLSVALALPIVWVGHANRTLQPVATMPKNAAKVDQIQWGLQATLFRF